MKRYDITKLSENEIWEIINRIKRGEIFIYPTDTVAGIGARADFQESVERINYIKGRDKDKPLSIAFSSIQQIKKYVELNEIGLKLANQFFPGDLTLITELRESNQKIYANPRDKSIGIRIIDCEILNKIIEGVGIPIITTSTNKSGQQPVNNVKDISPEIMKQIDFILSWKGELSGVSSTIIDIRNGFEIIRKGRISENYNLFNT